MKQLTYLTSHLPLCCLDIRSTIYFFMQLCERSSLRRYRQPSVFVEFLSPKLIKLIIHNSKLVKNDNFLVKNGLFIYELRVCSPKWRNIFINKQITRENCIWCKCWENAESQTIKNIFPFNLSLATFSQNIIDCFPWNICIQETNPIKLTYSYL